MFFFKGRIGLPGQTGLNGRKGDQGDPGLMVIEKKEKTNF
jgi:hypothetical protein